MFSCVLLRMVRPWLPSLCFAVRLLCLPHWRRGELHPHSAAFHCDYPAQRRRSVGSLCDPGPQGLVCEVFNISRFFRLLDLDENFFTRPCCFLRRFAGVTRGERSGISGDASVGDARVSCVVLWSCLLLIDPFD